MLFRRPSHPVAGTSRRGPRRPSFRPFCEELEDRRLLNAGALDPTFGVGGKVTGGFAHADGVAIQAADGKIVVAGSTLGGNGNFDIDLRRYLPNGSPDPYFGNQGEV